MGYSMKPGIKLINKNNSKQAEFIKQDETHTWVKIDGLAQPLKNEDFEKHYEVEEVFISGFSVEE